MKKECCVVIYNSYKDPLVQNLMLKYIITLNKSTGWRFHLITFEQPDYFLEESEVANIKKYLLSNGIQWYAKRHHSGFLLVAKKLYDFLSVGLLLFYLRLLGVKVLWSFANVAASIAWPYSRLLKFKTIIYSYEPHSDFMAELSMWTRSSFKYRLLRYLETRAGKTTDYILTGTKYMVQELSESGAKGKVFRAPTGVDEREFYFLEEGRDVVNRRYGFSSSDRIVLYVGKFGGLYYSWEIPFLFKVIRNHISNVRFIVITPTSYDVVAPYFEAAGFGVDNVICINSPTLEEIKIHMSSANLGINAIPPTPSQRFRSPTKVGEYLLCGLPYVTCRGVSEDDIVASEYNVGIVLNDFSEKSIAEGIPLMRNFLNMNRVEIAKKCRQVGLQYRAKKNVDTILKNIFEDLEGKHLLK